MSLHTENEMVAVRQKRHQTDSLLRRGTREENLGLLSPPPTHERARGHTLTGRCGHARFVKDSARFANSKLVPGWQATAHTGVCTPVVQPRGNSPAPCRPCHGG